MVGIPGQACHPMQWQWKWHKVTNTGQLSSLLVETEYSSCSFSRIKYKVPLERRPDLVIYMFMWHDVFTDPVWSKLGIIHKFTISLHVLAFVSPALSWTIPLGLSSAVVCCTSHCSPRSPNECVLLCCPSNTPWHRHFQLLPPHTTISQVVMQHCSENVHFQNTIYLKRNIAPL